MPYYRRGTSHLQRVDQMVYRVIGENFRRLLVQNNRHLRYEDIRPLIAVDVLSDLRLRVVIRRLCRRGYLDYGAYDDRSMPFSYKPKDYD